MYPLNIYLINSFCCKEVLLACLLGY
uniref:Uncharacterized protein n=1 Tax=Arundo donax TaxID=35708 RepID=A0A0A9HJD4_ARUDO